MQIKIIVAAVSMLAVFAAGAFAARWMLGEKHARELAEVRLAGLSAQLSFAGQATEQAAKTIEIIRRENETTQKQALLRLAAALLCMIILAGCASAPQTVYVPTPCPPLPEPPWILMMPPANANLVPSNLKPDAPKMP